MERLASGFVVGTGAAVVTAAIFGCDFGGEDATAVGVAVLTGLAYAVIAEVAGSLASGVGVGFLLSLGFEIKSSSMESRSSDPETLGLRGGAIFSIVSGGLKGSREQTSFRAAAGLDATVDPDSCCM